MSEDVLKHNTDEKIIELIVASANSFKKWEKYDVELCHNSKLICLNDISMAVDELRKRADKEFMTKADKILQEQ